MDTALLLFRLILFRLFNVDRYMNDIRACQSRKEPSVNQVYPMYQINKRPWFPLDQLRLTQHRPA